jgi:hypothetical protein
MLLPISSSASVFSLLLLFLLLFSLLHYPYIYRYRVLSKIYTSSFCRQELWPLDYRGVSKTPLRIKHLKIALPNEYFSNICSWIV